VFDGHGPLGHKFAQSIRDNLPSKLSTTIKMSQQNVSQQDGANATTSWENHLFSSFNEMDEDLAKNIAKTDGFCGGSVAVTLIKQVNMSMSS
jgi:serine/threonine protein phosphatase PrpC